MEDEEDEEERYGGDYISAFAMQHGYK